MKKMLIFLIIIFGVNLYARSFSDFSITSFPQDSSSIFNNPASLGLLGRFTFNSGYSRLLSGIVSNNVNSSEVSLGGNFWKISLGCGYQEFFLQDIFSQKLYLFNFGTKLFKESLFLGGNIKYYISEYIYDEYYIQDILATPKEETFNFDFGIIAKPTKSIFLGLSGTNLLKKLMGTQIKYFLPQKYIFSFSYLYGITLINTEILYSQTEVNNFQYTNLGAKFVLNQELFYSKLLSSDVTIGLQKEIDLSGFLLSFQIKFFSSSLGIKYTWFYPLVSITNFLGDHYISLNYTLSKSEKRKVIIRQPPKEKEEIIIIEKKPPKEQQVKKEQYQLLPSTSVIQPTLEVLTTKTTQAASVTPQEEKISLKEVVVSTTVSQSTLKTSDKTVKTVVIKEKEEVLVYRFPLAHKVKEGETLISISKKYYNNERGWKKIYEANKDKIIKGIPIVGEILIIPEP